MADMNQVLAKLSERTVEHRVPWGRSELSGTFQASFGDLTVYITGNRNGADRSVHLSVQDKRGTTIGSVFYSPKHPDENRDLLYLYKQATEIASDDPRLDELIDALDAAPLVS